MKTKLIALAILIAAVASGCVITDDSTLTVDNHSSYALFEIRVAEVNDAYYGPNLLGGDILYPGESLTVGLDCGTYDVLVVDEDGVECELVGLDVCLDDAVWIIDDIDLNLCAF